MESITIKVKVPTLYFCKTQSDEVVALTSEENADKFLEDNEDSEDLGFIQSEISVEVDGYNVSDVTEDNDIRTYKFIKNQ